MNYGFQPASHANLVELIQNHGFGLTDKGSRILGLKIRLHRQLPELRNIVVLRASGIRAFDFESS